MPNKLKIGFVLDDTLDTPDGVQQYVLTLGSWFARQGHEVHYLVGESSRKDIENVHSMARNLHVRFNKNRLSMPLPSNKKQISAKLKELDLDIIHVQMPYSPMFAGRVVSFTPASTKVVGTFHIVPAHWLHTAGARALELLNRRTLRQFDKIISVSSAAADFAHSAFGIESMIIPNSVDLKTMKRKPTVSKIPKVVFLGRLVERKGCQYLLKSLVKLQKQYHGDYQVKIAGKGPLKPKLEQYARKHNLKNVEFVDFVDEKDKPSLLAGADIAVFPSTGGESFGIVLIEAMAAGSRVVLGGDNVGYRTVLGDNPELLIDPCDSQAFANRLQYFLEHPKARKAAAKWAADNIAKYDINHVGKQILALYKKL